MIANPSLRIVLFLGLIAQAGAGCSSTSSSSPAESAAADGSVTDATSSSDSSTTSDAGNAAEASSWDASGSPAPSGIPASSAQIPPTDGASVRAWLQSGSYLTWHCESAVHESRSPSPHGMNRICSNDLASGFNPDAGATERPQGTAAVKELHDATGTTIIGYAVYLKAEPTSDGGASWYWYDE